MQPFDYTKMNVDAAARDTTNCILHMLEKHAIASDGAVLHPDIAGDFVELQCKEIFKQYFPTAPDDMLANAANHVNFAFARKYALRKDGRFWGYKFYDILKIVLPVIVDIIRQLTQKKENE